MKKLSLVGIICLFAACGNDFTPPEPIEKSTSALSACSYVGQVVGSIWIQSYLPDLSPTRYFVKWSCSPGATYDPVWSYDAGQSVWNVICATVGREVTYHLRPDGMEGRCLGFYPQYSTHDAYVVPQRECLTFKIEYGSQMDTYKFRATNPSYQMAGPYLQTVIYGGTAAWHCNCANCNTFTAQYLLYTPYGSDFLISEL